MIIALCPASESATSIIISSADAQTSSYPLLNSLNELSDILCILWDGGFFEECGSPRLVLHRPLQGGYLVTQIHQLAVGEDRLTSGEGEKAP